MVLGLSFVRCACCLFLVLLPAENDIRVKQLARYSIMSLW